MAAPALHPDVVAILEVAESQVGVREHGRNRGPQVEAYLRAVGLGPDHPWCAAFVCWCGVSAVQDRWPLPRTGWCPDLGTFAVERNARYLRPQRGDVFLIYHPSLGRFAHTGYVTAVLPDGRYETIEGNSNDTGSREGDGVYARTGARARVVGPQDRFIRLSELLSEEAP